MGFRFEQLEIWHDANTFVNNIYNVTKHFPREELFSLTDQLKRSAASISANIAEGSGSASKKDFSHYIDISIKSLYETVSHLHLAANQKYIDEVKKTELYLEAEILSKKMQAFKNWLKRS